MIPFREVIGHITAQPFVPFQIHTASGRTFAVKHPEFVHAGVSSLIVFSDDNPDGPNRWEKLSYMLIESLAPLNLPAPSQGAA